MYILSTIGRKILMCYKLREFRYFFFKCRNFLLKNLLACEKVTLFELKENGVAQVFQGPQNSVCNDTSACTILSDSLAPAHYDI